MPDAPLKIKFNTPFQQAVEAANQRGVMLPADYYALPAAMRSRQFTVSYLAKLDQIQAILTSLQKAQISGISLQQWQKEIDYKQFEITKAHAETVFRNAMQTHYAIGHWESFQRTKKALPYLRYSAINDSRTSACCRALSGIIRRVDDPFWATHTPPNHHNCRSTLQALTESQAQKRSPAGVGLNQVESADMNPQKGWDYNPAVSHDAILKDLIKQKIERLPPVIQSTLDEKIRQMASFFSARNYVLQNGLRNAVDEIEFAYVYDGNGSVLIKKQGIKKAVNFTDDEIKKMRNANKVTIVHNHPSNSSLSQPDLLIAAHVNGGIHAIAHSGSEYFGAVKDVVVLGEIYHFLVKDVQNSLFRLVDGKVVSRIEADELHNHIVNLVLNHVGIIAYTAYGDFDLKKEVAQVISDLSGKYHDILAN
jgi:SPP1 gp7 family putative phage head morphogenesis protein